MRLALSSFALLAALAAAGTASATPVTLQFDQAAAGRNFGTVTEAGYQVTGSGSHFISLGGARYCNPACPDNGSNNLMAMGGRFTLAASNGSSFDLLGFDGAETQRNLRAVWARGITVTGTTRDGAEVSASFALDGVQDGGGAAVDFERFTPDASFSDLVSVVFSGTGGRSLNAFTLDNITVRATPVAQRSPQISPVPEPGALALVGVALGALALVRRRRT